MKTEFLKSLGLEQGVIDQIMAENGKDIKSEKDKAKEKLDALQERLDTAQDTLNGFEGVDLATIQSDLAKYKKQAEDAEKDYNEKLAQRDFEDALKVELESVRFSSEAAKKAVVAEIREAGLKVKNGKIMGLSDFLSQVKEKDASAFVNEEQEKLEAEKARFTGKLEPGKETGKKQFKDWREIMDIKDPVERQAAIRDNTKLFEKE